MTAVTEEPRPVRLLSFPLALHVQAEEHHNELMREFSLIALGIRHAPDSSVPKRLLELVDVLTRDYGGVTEPVNVERDAALAAGRESVDLTYQVPPAAAEASRALATMLAEADEFCSSSGALLTLATPPEARLFRDWYLQEFVSQLEGSDPVPWPEYARAAQGRT